MNYQQHFLGTTTFCTLDGQRRSLSEIYSMKKTTIPPEVLAEDEDGNIVVVGLVGISRPSTSELPKRIFKNPGYFRILFKQGTFIDLLLSNRLVLKNSKKAVHPDKLKTNKRISALYQQYRHSNGTHDSPDYVSLIKPPKSKFIDRSTMPRHMFSYALYSTNRRFQHYRKTNQRGIHSDQQQQIHHKDYDSQNDSGSNLEILSKPDHNALHCRDHQDKPSQKTTKLLLTFMVLGIIPTKDQWDRAISPNIS